MSAKQQRLYKNTNYIQIKHARYFVQLCHNNDTIPLNVRIGILNENREIPKYTITFDELYIMINFSKRLEKGTQFSVTWEVDSW